MLQLWEPNAALSSPHKFSNLSWLLTRGAFWNTEPILLPLAQEVPEPLSAGCGEESPCACPVLALFLAYLPTVDSSASAGERAGACRQPLHLVLLPSSSDCTLVPSKTDCTYCIVCFSLRENINEMHFLALLKGSTWITAALTELTAALGICSKPDPHRISPWPENEPHGKWTLMSEAWGMGWRELLHWCTCLSTKKGQRDVHTLPLPRIICWEESRAAMPTSGRTVLRWFTLHIICTKESIFIKKLDQKKPKSQT